MRNTPGLLLATAAIAGLALSACSAIVEQRVETRLAEAGLPEGMASCMATIWADDLSVDQIRGIGDFADGVRQEGRDLTVDRLIGHAREWNDPRALAVVASSAARCALR